MNAAGEIPGKGDLRKQVRQVFVILQGRLDAAGAGTEHAAGRS